MFALADLALIAILLRVAPRVRFAAARRWVSPCAFLVWFGIWLSIALFLWEPVYARQLPEWARWALPPGMGFLFAALASVMCRLAERWKLAPALTFVLLGAALGPLTQLWGLARGARGAGAAIAIAAPEFGFYFGLILLLATIASARAPSAPARSPRSGGTT